MTRSSAALSRRRNTPRLIAVLASVFLVPLVGVADPPQTWPQWRGPSRDGQVGRGPWPEDLKGLTQLWRVELGESYSGPIVAADRVFVTETVDKKRESVRALDRTSGRELWRAEWDGSIKVPFFAAKNGDWIRATPAYDGQCLYVAGIRDVLVCLDAADGRERWRVDFLQRHGSPVPAFGFVSSPLVTDQFVYVQAGGGVSKLDKGSGAEVWRTLEDGGGMNGSAFASPVLATIAGAQQLIVQTRAKLAGVDPATGALLWSKEIPAFQGMNILTPVVQGDAVFTSAHSASTFLFRLSRAGEEWKIEEAWQNKAQGYMSTPVVVDGHVYMHLRNRRFSCIELATGREVWRTEPFGEYWSLAAQGPRILALDERGELLLVKANPEKFELLDRRKVSEQETWGHVAVCDDQVFVRELKAIVAYRWK